MTQPASDGSPGQTDTDGPVPDGPGPGGPRGASSVRDRVVVVTPEGMAVSGSSDEDSSPTELIEQPAKVMRIGSMIKQLLEEVRSAPLDEAGRTRLAQIHSRSISELEQGLAPELVEELRRITLPFEESATPSDAELRIAQAQLVGWLEGLFHGIQTALFAQQMAARAQLEQMRRALPGGPGAAALGGLRPGGQGRDEGQEHATGQYL
jgi:Bacterial proteasome activator